MTSAGAAQSEWAQLDSSGKLTYKTLPRGDRIADFSHAGYAGGGVKLPTVPVQKTIAPAGNDDSDAIQSAIDAVANRSLTNGFRGAIQLEAGRFHCAKPITIAQDGIVLCGSGSETNGTVIEMTGPPHVCFTLDGPALESPKETKAVAVSIVDAYVPSGAVNVSVNDATGLAVGDTVLVRWQRTAEWIHFMGMDTLVRNGKAQTWMKNDSSVGFERTIRAISENRLTLDLPLTDCIDRQFLKPGSAVVVKTTPPQHLSHCALESLRIVSPPPKGSLAAPNNTAVFLDHCEDCWVKDLTMHDTLNIVRVMGGARRITVEAVRAVHTTTVEKGSGSPSDFTLAGSQILVDRCASTGDGAFFIATLNPKAVLNVALNCHFEGKGGVQPHMHWSTGLLIDRCELPDGGVEFINRGTGGSGHGWSLGWGVVWNCVAKRYIIQQPPGAMNWVIGCKGATETKSRPDDKGGPKLPSGIVDSHDTPVTPASLYLAQLRERLGPEALVNIGY